MIERQHLAILREVERSGSLTAAADTLCITQSAASHAIKRLEARLGTALWERNGRALSLTQAGRLLLQLAKRVLPQLEHAEDMLREMVGGSRGTLRIGIECHPCFRWLQRFVGGYLASWPDVDLDIRQEFQFGGMAALFSQEIDLLVTPDPIQRRGVTFMPVFDYELMLAVAQTHPLAQAESIEPAALADQVLFTYPVETERLDVYTRFLIPAGILPRRHKTIETTEIMLQLVAAGRGVSALPDWLVAEYSRLLPLVAVRLGKSGVHKQLHLGTRRGDAETLFIRSFIDHAKNAPA